MSASPPSDFVCFVIEVNLLWCGAVVKAEPGSLWVCAIEKALIAVLAGGRKATEKPVVILSVHSPVARPPLQ